MQEDNMWLKPITLVILHDPWAVVEEGREADQNIEYQGAGGCPPEAVAILRSFHTVWKFKVKLKYQLITV